MASTHRKMFIIHLTWDNALCAVFWGRPLLQGWMPHWIGETASRTQDTVHLMGMLCLQERWHKANLKTGYNYSRTSHEHFRQLSWHASSGKRSPWRYSSLYLKVTILQYLVLTNISQLTPFERRWEDRQVGLKETDTRQAGRDRTVYHCCRGLTPVSN